MTGAILVFVTTSSADEAARIGRALVEERLVACANVVPGVRSIYRWEGKVADEAELLLLLKTRRSRFAAVERRVRELHSYEVPEVVAVDLVDASAPYLEWLLGETVED
ncbi:MAG: divalent-cation tolerance protein CutA [Candidatus Binatia bacterium]